MIVLERRGNRKDEGIGGLRLSERLQFSRTHRAPHQNVEIRFDDMDFSPIDGSHNVLVSIHPGHLHSTTCEHCSGR